MAPIPWKASTDYMWIVELGVGILAIAFLVWFLLSWSDIRQREAWLNGYYSHQQEAASQASQGVQAMPKTIETNRIWIGNCSIPSSRISHRPWKDMERLLPTLQKHVDADSQYLHAAYPDPDPDPDPNDSPDD